MSGTIRLRYGNTNTFYIPGGRGGLLIDTDWAGTLPRFFRALGEAGLELGDIAFLFLTHYHPDHMGLAGELQRRGIPLLAADVQVPFFHFSDGIFRREGRRDYIPVDDGAARVISLSDSRAVLREAGIDGEIVSTPSHSPDSVSVLLDGGDCFVGDLEPYSYLEAYGDNPPLGEPLRGDWERILRGGGKRIFFAHHDEQAVPDARETGG